MPGRYYGRRRNIGPLVTSIKNQFTVEAAIGTGTAAVNPCKAVTTPSPTVATDVSHGCIVKAFWVSLDFCGLSGSGALATTTVYLFKNPGANLTAPAPVSVGSSNEKKFVIKTWSAQTMRNQEGNPPYHWEGWVKIPKRYQRMGTDDLWQLVHATTTGAGHLSVTFIYKWYR